MSDNEAELVRRCLTGDEGKMRHLVERFQGIVFGICLRMLYHREDAEDVTQDVFLRVFRSLHRWDSSRPLRPWILTIATNRCRTFLEQRSRRPVASEIVENLAEDCVDGSSNDLAEELQRAVDRLRDEYRTCFILFHQQDLSCTEVGEIMGTPVGTIKTWLHRARKELAAHLKRRGVVPDSHYNQFQNAPDRHENRVDPGIVRLPTGY